MECNKNDKPLNHISRFFKNPPRICKNKVLYIIRMPESVCSRKIAAETVTQKNHLLEADLLAPLFQSTHVLELGQRGIRVK